MGGRLRAGNGQLAFSRPERPGRTPDPRHSPGAPAGSDFRSSRTGWRDCACDRAACSSRTGGRLAPAGSSVSILGFENCQSFFRSLPMYGAQHLSGRHRAADAVRHIAYFIGKTTLRSSYQPTTCEQLYKKHNIVTCLYKTSRLLQ